MIFDGMRWTRSKVALTLPDDWQPPEEWGVPESMRGYVFFARAVRGRYGDYVTEKSPDGDVPEGAVLTNWRARDGRQFGARIYAVPVEPDGWGATNKMYGKDRVAYLAYRGLVYVRSWRLSPSAKAHRLVADRGRDGALTHARATRDRSQKHSTRSHWQDVIDAIHLTGEEET